MYDLLYRKKRKTNTKELLVTLIFFFSSLVLFQIPFHSMTFFMVFEIIFVIYMFMKRKKLYRVSSWINLIFIEMIISAGFSFVGPLPLSYRKTAVYMTVLVLPMYFVIMYLQKLTKENINWVCIIKRAIRAMCMVQVTYCCIQFVAYRFGIDLNQLIFVDLLHVMEKASTTKLSPTGFAWHPAVLAPMLMLSYFLLNKPIWRILTIFVAFVCNNATSLIGMMLCLSSSLFDMVFIQKRFKRKTLLIIFGIVFVGVIVGIYTGFLNEAIQKLVTIYGRITGSVPDDSAVGHKRYYTALPFVIKNSSFTQILFGYGAGCSGFPIDVLYAQYTDLSNWSVECDFMNILYSWGITGFILYYGMLVSIMVKGWKIDKKYTYLVMIITLQGITYNVQFEWMQLIMMCFYFCTRRGINFFALGEKVKEKSINVACNRRSYSMVFNNHSCNGRISYKRS